MTEESLWSIFVNAALVNNFVLAYFLGICPFLGVSAKMATATRMGGAVVFVMLVSSLCAYGNSSSARWSRSTRTLSAAHLVHRGHCVDGSTGRDVHQEGQPRPCSGRWGSSCR